MNNLPQNGVTCDCGSDRLAPALSLQPGELCICEACGKTFRARLALDAVRWSEVVAELKDDRPWDFCALAWIRRGVPLERRRGLAELSARAGRFTSSERAGAACGVVFVLVVAFVVLRAVLS